MQKPFSLGNPSKRNVMLFAFPPTKLLRNNEGALSSCIGNYLWHAANPPFPIGPISPVLHAFMNCRQDTSASYIRDKRHCVTYC